MNRPVVFLGPSLPIDEARELVDADFRGPVAQGDVLRALESRPVAIVIVDGYFELVPAVWHKEILVALHRGVPVYGASSMGALRAAELHRFGMVGVGRVFEWFRDGVLTDDDEVAIVHSSPEDGHRPLSDAMVDIRAAVADAVDAGVVEPDAGSELLGVAKGMHYAQRSFASLEQLLWGTGLSQPAAALRRHADQFGPWQKHRDAAEALRVVGRALREGSLRPPQPPEPLNRTVFLEMLHNETAQRELHSETPSAGDFPLPEPLEGRLSGGGVSRGGPAAGVGR